jgi:RecB family exonuclease
VAVRVLENTFSWSCSRAATFERCKREYWWQYYGSWGGWEPTAPPEAREAYVLKNLTTRWAWVGTVVHEVIERILRRIRRRTVGGDDGQLELGGLDLEVEPEVERTTQGMRRQFRESKRGEYRDLPKKRFGLAEHAYADPVADDEWRQIHAKAIRAIRVFLASDLFERIRATDPADWFPIEERTKFSLDGVDVWAAPDFALRRPDGGAEIYDWKTGMANEANRLQLACYTLYMAETHGVNPARVRNHLVYLGDDVVVRDFVLTDAELADARARIAASSAEMKRRLVDAPGNRAEREDFPQTTDLEKCKVCVFRRLCGR